MGRDRPTPDSGWLGGFTRREGLSEAFGENIAAIYLPIAQRIATDAGSGSRRKPWVVGLCGPQGSGKTTGVAVLDHLLAQAGFRIARLSIDDLYRSHAERGGLAERVHPLFATRGVPGTHDVDLGLATFDALAGAGPVALPGFDKATDDRLPRDRWPTIDAPVDIILFEGWCVGARPQQPAALTAPVNRLEAEEDPDGRWRRYANDQLAGPYQALFARIDLLVLLTAPDFATVTRWRAEQEDKLRARNGAGGAIMDDAALARFMQHYERLTRHIAAEMLARADVVIALDAARRPVATRGLPA